MLVAELLRRGYTDEDIKKIASRNILRVMRAAEATAAKSKATGAGTRVSRWTRDLSPLPASFHGQRHDPLIVALGDSTTAGTPLFKSPIEAPPDGSGDERSQFAYWLMQQQPDWSVLNRGVNGERSRSDRRALRSRRPRARARRGHHHRRRERRLSGPDGGPRRHAPAGDVRPRAPPRGIPGRRRLDRARTTRPRAEQNRKMREINAWIAAQPARDRNIIAVDTRAAVSRARQCGSAGGISRRPASRHRRLPRDGGRARAAVRRALAMRR